MICDLMLKLLSFNAWPLGVILAIVSHPFNVISVL